MCCWQELRRCVGQHRAADRAERDAAGDAEVGRHVAGGLLAERPLVGRGEAPPAVLDRERDAGEARRRTACAAGPGRRRCPPASGRRGRGRVGLGGRGSRFASIQARASRAELVDVDLRVGHVVPSSEPGQLAQVLAVPGGVAEQPGVGRDAAQVQVLVVLPRVPDAAEHLEAGLRPARCRRRRRTPWPCWPPAARSRRRRCRRCAPRPGRPPCSSRAPGWCRPAGA